MNPLALRARPVPGPRPAPASCGRTHATSMPRSLTRPRVRLALLLALAAVLGSPVGAQANAGNQIIRQCLATDSVSGHYTQQDYAWALAHLPSDVAEYSDCQDVIRRAELAAAGGRTGLVGPGGAIGAATRDPFATASAAEKASIIAAQRARPGRLRVGSDYVSPGSLAVAPSAFLHRLPGPLLAALAALIAAALAAAAWLGRDRLRDVRPRRPR